MLVFAGIPQRHFNYSRDNRYLFHKSLESLGRLNLTLAPLSLGAVGMAFLRESIALVGFPKRQPASGLILNFPFLHHHCARELVFTLVLPHSV
jgi:hypothetical protein